MRSWAGRLLAVFGLLLSQTACLEHFTALETTVEYDAYDQTFRVKRVLRNLSPGFFGCGDLGDCTEAVDRAVALQPAAFPTALSDRLVQRLVESGAQDLEVRLEADGDKLDAVISYAAPVGSAAAEDTLVHAEWAKGKYYLVVDADASLRPLDVRARIRKTAMSGPEGIDWREAWVLKPRVKKVTTTMDVDDTVRPLFATVAGLGEALAAKGWLDGAPISASPAVAVVDEPTPAPASAPMPSPAAPASAVEPMPAPTPAPAPQPDPAPEPAPIAAPTPAPAPAPTPSPSPTPAPSPSPSPSPTPAPTPAPVAPAPAPSVATSTGRSWPAPDPDSPARTYVYDARVSGGGISVSAANVSAEPLMPRVRVCYQEAVQRNPAAGGSAFLSALVKADGSLASTSVYGSVGDPSLMQCLELAMDGWSFRGWGGEGVTDVAIPLVFRVEASPGKKRGKKKR